MRRGRDKTLPETTQQSEARMAVTPMMDEESGIKKQQAIRKICPAVVNLSRIGARLFICIDFLSWVQQQ
jgi:hypothetical protein